MRVATKLLQKSNYSVLTAVNGKDAYDKICSHNLKLVLMDIDMPVLGGIESTKLVRLRENELNLPRLPILALTASVLQSQENSVLEAGLDYFLTKPIRIEQLLQVIQSFLNH